MKPTYGLVSRFGLVAYASSIDQVGPLTRTVHDNALVLSCIAGADENDSTCRPEKLQDYTRGLTGKIKPGLKLVLLIMRITLRELIQKYKLLQESLKEYERLGARLRDSKTPLMDCDRNLLYGKQS